MRLLFALSIAMGFSVFALKVSASNIDSKMTAFLLNVSCLGNGVLVEIQQNALLSKRSGNELLKLLEDGEAKRSSVFAIARVSLKGEVKSGVSTPEVTDAQLVGQKLPTRPGTLYIQGGELRFSASAVGESEFRIDINPNGTSRLIDARLGEKEIEISCSLETQLPQEADEKQYKKPLVELSQTRSEFMRLSPSAFTTDGEALLTSDEPWLIAFDPTSGEQLYRLGISKFDKISVAPDGDRLAMAAINGGVFLFSLDSGKVIWRSNTSIDSSFNEGIIFEFGPLGKRIFMKPDSSSFSDVGRLSVIDAATGKVSELATDVISTFGAVFSDDGQFAFVAGFDDLKPVIEKFDLASNKTIAKAELFKGVLTKPNPLSDWFIIYDEKRLKILDHQLRELSVFTYPSDFDRGEHGAVRALVNYDASYALLIANNGNFLFAELAGGQTVLAGKDHAFLDDLEFDFFPFAALSHDSTLLATTVWGIPESKLTVFELPRDWSNLTSFPTLYDQKRSLLVNLAEENLALFREGLAPEIVVDSPFAQPLLHDVVARGSQDYILSLIEAGADIDELNSRSGKPAILVALEAGNAEAANILLNLDASIDAISESGETFLSTVLSADPTTFSGTPLAVFRSQLAEQFSPEKIDNHLVAVAAKGKLNIIATLLSIGADPNYVGTDGLTALMLAAASTSPDAFERVQALLRWGNADPNIATNEGATALALAIAAGADEKIIGTLTAVSDLERGVNGTYVWDVAQSVGNSEILGILPEQGWRPPNIPMPTVAPIELRLGGNMSKSDIQQVQKELKDRGLYSSNIDGLWGPASRRGLASYFKVVFDDHREVMKKFCGLVVDDVKKRRSASEDYLGKASFSGLEWEYEGWLFGIGLITTLRDTSTGYSVTCELRISDLDIPIADAVFDLSLARIITREYDVALDFMGEGRCKDIQWIKSALFMSNDPVAMDFACQKTMAGVPVNSSGTATIWRKY